MAMVRNFGFMVGTNAEPLCVCNSEYFAMSYIRKLFKLMLNNLRKIGGLVLYRISCFSMEANTQWCNLKFMYDDARRS
jgi:hypothetical protein